MEFLSIRILMLEAEALKESPQAVITRGLYRNNIVESIFKNIDTAEDREAVALYLQLYYVIRVTEQMFLTKSNPAS